MDERGGRGGSRAEKGRATVAKKEKGERASEAKAVGHSGSDGGGGGSEPITYYNCLASERASERAPVKHPSSRRMASLPITSAVIANFSRSSLLPCSAYLLLAPPPSLSLARPPLRPCLVARLLDHPTNRPTRQLASTFARLGNFPLPFLQTTEQRSPPPSSSFHFFPFVPGRG